MNRHSFLRGNDLQQTQGRCLRGQRVFCSNRGQRGGCGKTFALVLAEVLPRHTVTATLLWRWLRELLAGLSIKAAAEKLRLPFVLETFHRLTHDPKRLTTPVVNRTLHTYHNTLRILCEAFQIEFEGRDHHCERLLVQQAFSVHRAGKMLVPIIDDVVASHPRPLRQLPD